MPATDVTERRDEGSLALSYGMRDPRFSAFPTFVLLTLGQGKAATIEPTTVWRVGRRGA